RPVVLISWFSDLRVEVWIGHLAADLRPQRRHCATRLKFECTGADLRAVFESVYCSCQSIAGKMTIEFQQRVTECRSEGNLIAIKNKPLDCGRQLLSFQAEFHRRSPICSGSTECDFQSARAFVGSDCASPRARRIRTHSLSGG